MNPKNQINHYLTDLLVDFSADSPTPSSQLPTESQLIDVVFQKLMSKKFRSSSISDEFQAKIKAKLQKTITSAQPLHFTVPFGGYKLWRFPTYPNPDWSEVFNIRQILSYLSPITAIYEPGIILEYFSDEIMVSRMNNIPQSDLDSYNHQFAHLIDWFNLRTPTQIDIRFSKIRDFISSEDYWRSIDEDMPRIEKLWESQPEEIKSIRLKKASRNYRGDLSSLSEAKREEVLLASSLCHDGFIFGTWDKDIPWAFADHMIALGFRYTEGWGIPIKSSRTSLTQFWVGTGLLLHTGKQFLPTIKTYSQFKAIEPSLNYFDVNIFPESFSNLHQIGVYTQP